MNIIKTVKAWIAYLLDRTIVPLVEYVYNKVMTNKQAVNKAPSRTILDALWDKAIISSAEYVESHMPYAVKFSDRKKLLDFGLSKIELKGLYAEFGVFQGESINHIASKLTGGVILYGFDSFEGLQEDWRGQALLKGHFSLNGQLPMVKENVELIKGWFDETVPQFLKCHPGPFAFIHMDCDTYEAVRSVLRLIGERLVTGTVIVFDEYFGYTGWKVGEWKAWQEYVADRGVKYEYLGFSVHQVAIRILS